MSKLEHNPGLSLESRHDIERQFHDSKAAAHHDHHHHHDPEERSFYSHGGMDGIWDSYLRSIGPLKDRTVLDFGCGEGWSTLQYCKRGAQVFSFDISPESLQNLLHQAAETGVVSKIRPAVMAAEYLCYPSKTFDLVLGVSILHHTDVTLVGNEVSRVLKPGGKAFFIEPLAHNIFLKLFRRLTPTRRTPTEQPMTVEQIDEFIRSFQWGEYRGQQFLSIFPQGLFWLTGNQRLFKVFLGLTEAIDRVLLRIFPFLQKYCWAAIIEVRN